MGLIVVTVRLPYVQTYRDRHGRVRHYLRRPGAPRLALPGEPGSVEFMAAYHAEPVAKTERNAAGTVNALAIAYYSSAEFSTLAAMTKRTYRNIVEKFRAANGDKPFGDLRPESVRHMVAKRAGTPATANALLKMLRIMARFAIAEGWLKDDPTAGVKRIRSKSEGFATWSEADIAQFEARWPLGTRQRLAMALLLYTGQRRSDVIGMGRQHVRAGRIAVRQQKTGERLAVMIHPRLHEALDATSSDHLTFLTTDAGAPFTSAGFGNWFHDAVAAAGLSGIAAHGLRKAAARRLAEAGCTANQIAAITGHRSLREVERYTRAADQITNGDAAILKLSV